MLETLTGRIRWERKEDGIRVLIPERFDVGPIGDALLVGLIPILAIDVVSKADRQWSGWSWEKISLALLCFVALLVLLGLYRRTEMTLTPVWMTVQRGPFGLNWPWRKLGFATRRLDNLRSTPSTSNWSGKSLRGRITVQFDQDSFTHDLARELTEAEAASLVSLMLKTYSFPQNPERPSDGSPVEED